MKQLKFRFVLALHLFVMLSACGNSSAYDASKAEQLTEEQRREMDVLLANELATFNTLSTRCGVDHIDGPYGAYGPFKCRINFINELASQGYEMADIALKLYAPTRGEMTADLDAYQRLHDLAASGDQSAMCFAPFVIRDLGSYSHQFDELDWPYSFSSELKYAKQGADRGLPVCAFVVARTHQNGYLPTNFERFHHYALIAAKGGVYLGQKYLMVMYKNQFASDVAAREGYYYDESIDLLRLRKALCWGRLAQRHSVSAEHASFVTGLRSLYSRDNQNDRSRIIYPELIELANKWSLRTNPHKTFPVTINDCMKIEEEQ